MQLIVAFVAVRKQGPVNYITKTHAYSNSALESVCLDNWQLSRLTIVDSHYGISSVRVAVLVVLLLNLLKNLFKP